MRSSHTQTQPRRLRHLHARARSHTHSRAQGHHSCLCLCLRIAASVSVAVSLSLWLISISVSASASLCLWRRRCWLCVCEWDAGLDHQKVFVFLIRSYSRNLSFQALLLRLQLVLCSLFFLLWKQRKRLSSLLLKHSKRI